MMRGPPLKRILMLLANEFKPDVRVEKEALALAGAGYDIDILAWGRSRRSQEEHSPNFSVRRLWVGRFSGKLGAVLGLPIFSLRSLLSGIRERPDIVHSHDLDTLLQGMLISRIKGVPLVYDAHEHYARMIEQDVPTFLVPLVDSFEMALVGKADLVVAANIKIAEYLAPRASKVVVVMNCIDISPIVIEIGEKQDTKLVLFYGGSLEPLRYLEEVMDAVSRDQRFQLRIAGSGTLGEKVEVMAKAHDNIHFLGRIPQDAVISEMAKADAVLALLDPRNENNRIGTPNRLFEAMAMGVPVIVSAGTYSAEIVQECGCGIAIDWNPEALTKVIKLIGSLEQHRLMGERGRNAVESNYNWNRMSKILIEAYQALPPK